jgi:hypothetical protein
MNVKRKLTTMRREEEEERAHDNSIKNFKI